MGTRARQMALLFSVGGSILLAGCGGDDKPAYCSARDDLKESVDGLDDVRLRESGGVDRLRSQLKEVQTNADKVADTAKNEFGDEVQGLRTSVTELNSSVRGLVSDPSAAQASEAKAAVDGVRQAVDRLVSATDSNC